MQHHRFCGILLRYIYNTLDGLPVISPHQREYIGKTHFLRILSQIHNAVYIGDSAIIRCHLLIPFKINPPHFSVKHKVTENRKNNKQHRPRINIIHQVKCQNRCHASEHNTPYIRDSINQLICGSLRRQGILIIELTVFKAGQLHIGGLFKQAQIQLLMHLSTCNRPNLSLQILVIECHGRKHRHRHTKKNKNRRHFLLRLHGIDYIPHKKRTVKQPFKIPQNSCHRHMDH